MTHCECFLNLSKGCQHVKILPPVDLFIAKPVNSIKIHYKKGYGEGGGREGRVRGVRKG